MGGGIGGEISKTDRSIEGHHKTNNAAAEWDDTRAALNATRNADAPVFKTIPIAKWSGTAKPKHDPRMGICGKIAKTEVKGSNGTTREGKGRGNGLKHPQGRDKNTAKSGEGVNNGPTGRRTRSRSPGVQKPRWRRSSPGTSSPEEGPGRARGRGRGKVRFKTALITRGLHRRGQARL